jgi:hypothetical protein
MIWWSTLTTVATWACALSALACAIVITLHIRFQWRAHQATMMALRSMSDTYNQGWELMGADIEALKARIIELETFRR